MLTYVPAAFGSAVFHILYNIGRFRLLDGTGLSFRVAFSFLPLVSALYGSFTGISDNRHYIEDVLFGAFIGTLAAVIFYSIYFPPIFNVMNSGRAYPPRKLGVSFLLGPLASFLPFDDAPRVAIDGIPPELTITTPRSKPVQIPEPITQAQELAAGILYSTPSKKKKKRPQMTEGSPIIFSMRQNDSQPLGYPRAPEESVGNMNFVDSISRNISSMNKSTGTRTVRHKYVNYLNSNSSPHQ